MQDEDAGEDNQDEDDSIVLQMTDGRQVLAIEAKDGRQWSFNLGDMQEHKYDNPDVW